MAERASEHMQHVLDALGFEGDPEMDGSARRFAGFLKDWVPSDGAPELSVCASSMPGQCVAMRTIPFHSLCAHHLLPFFGTVSVAYQAGEQLVGFGAIPRLVRWASRQPQLQERLAKRIGDQLTEAVAPQAVLVQIHARHLCVEMRGTESPAEILVEYGVGDTAPLRALIGS